MSLINCIKENRPNVWQSGNGSYNGKFIISIYSDEYDKIEKIIKKSQLYDQDILRIERVQNVLLYGQFLFREQHLLADNTSTYYVVRRFIKIERCDLREALNFNLDPRRMDFDKLTLYKKTNYVQDDFVLLVVLVLTDNHFANVVPLRSNDYYIEYVVTFE